MKKIVLFLAFMFFMDIAFPFSIKEKDVPVAVRESFKKLYPNSYVYEWEYKKKKELYEAEFYLKGEKYKSYFDEKGYWQHTEIKVKDKILPPKITEQLSKTQYAKWKIDEVKKQLSPNVKDLTYIIEVEMGKREILLHYSEAGILLSEYPKK